MTDRSSDERREEDPRNSMEKKEWRTPRMEKMDVTVQTQTGIVAGNDGTAGS